jgi:hypothetical protein
MVPTARRQPHNSVDSDCYLALFAFLMIAYWAEDLPTWADANGVEITLGVRSVGRAAGDRALPLSPDDAMATETLTGDELGDAHTGCNLDQIGPR